jgi:hypothetical protein
MNPYMRFYFERTCEEKSKGNVKMFELNTKLAEEWKTLSAKKRDFYQKVY